MLLALLLAQVLAPANPDGPIFTNPASMGALAFFEAFPSTGRGTYGACPVPNWALYSEQFDNAAWSKGAFGGPSVPTVTANQATAPDGTLSADLVSFPATAGAQDSSVFQAFGGGTWAGSVYVMGQSGSGTLDLCMYNLPTTCTPCSYTASSWTRCQVLGTPTTNGNFYIGNMSSINGGTARSLNAVYLWGGMANIGTTVAAYVRTTTVAAALQPTGAKGEALTFTRASTSMCTKTSTGGLATTGIANGDLVLYPSNMSRVEYDANGTLGLLVESARTNSCLRSEQLDNAAWSNVATGVAAPTLNGANAAVAPDGTTTAEDYTFPATAAGQQSIRLGNIVDPTCNSQVCTGTIFVKGVSGSGTLDICTWDTGTPDCVACAYTDAAWSRCTITQTETGNVSVGVGNSTLWNGGTARSSNRVYVWGAQLELGSYATSYIPTVAATATRAVDRATMAVSWPTTASTSCVAATLTGQPYTVAGAYWSASLELGTDYLAGYTSGSANWNCQATSGGFVQRTASPAMATGSGNFRQAVAQSGTTINSYLNGTLYGTATAGSSSAWTPNRIGIGGWGNSPSYAADAIVSRVVADPTETRCR